MPKATLYPDIDDVPGEIWDALAQNADVTMGRPFWRAIQSSGFNDFSYRHVLIWDDHGAPIGLSSLYTVTTDLAIFAPRILRSLLKGVRRFWPRFLQWQMLECGTPITITSPPFVVVPGQEKAFLACLQDTLITIARKERQLLIVVRDFEGHAQGLRDDFAAAGFHWVDSLPNTYLDIAWTSPEAYRKAMRSYYRSKLDKHMRRYGPPAVTHKLVDDFGDLAGDLQRQWMVVHTHAKEFQREVLTADFYRHLAHHMPSTAKVLLFYRDGVWVGHALLLMDRDTLRWLYVGRETSDNDGLYLYVACTVVETAILLNAKRLEMGLTTYTVKQDLGAHVEPIAMALRSPWGLINFFVGRGYAVLNKVPKPAPRKVFKGA